MSDIVKVKNALISVSDKNGLTEFAQELSLLGIQIYSTGGTRSHLENQGLQVHDVSEYTGFPEVMDGRVKTLHPKIFAGILYRHDHDDDIQTLKKHEIHGFELVIVNLYPFEKTIAQEHVTQEEAIEQIDIGGPSLVRASAKNHAFTSIITRPDQYPSMLEELRHKGGTSLETRTKLAQEAFTITADYDRAISNYFCKTEKGPEPDFPDDLQLSFKRNATLRYGENPHQRAALYEDEKDRRSSLVHARQLNGKELSYNNFLDLEGALNLVRCFNQPCVSVIKHNNPCGAAVSETLSDAAEKALAGDPLSAFGSILALNQTVDAATAEILVRPGQFIEAIVAPGFSTDAHQLLTTKPKWKNNVRLLEIDNIEQADVHHQYRQISGGMLVQDSDVLEATPEEWEVVTDTKPQPNVQAELLFSWKIVRHVKSNAIAICRNHALMGAGAGQMSRVDSVEIAIKKAAERAQGAVLASDAFFPFPDSIEAASQAGICAIIQPGGSRRDKEVIEACNQQGISMIFTGRRHFRH